ncbi:TPA: hypothetical protein SMM80_003124 [Proteus mirabilis]|uniref:hypothetical protein n=1 Tax=Proteus mirabilis TaxID=584 RepID=UPI000666DEF0|nr:hypothetical protein [Proteus mirabilis]ARA20992.1 hypothetical protein AM438_00170 [Proteus mirabilis]EKV0743412.1 hypothetical protein [Proteus mirabilis]EME2732770.1 hypothetical protein [Proteus mirabilis]MBG3101278.1 hypothetical protein [Proteus mirabilis]MBG5967651.1 hypothetical protein [Proteus mirabilis]
MIHYPEYILDIIWQRAKKISADNETKGFRKDKETKWIKRQMFNQQNEFGWVLSKQPSSIHQLIEDETIVPLHWQTARAYEQKQEASSKRLNMIPLDPPALSKLIQSPTDVLPYWQHAHQISSDNEEKGFRKDYYGRIIQKNAFGDKQHQYGWTLAQLTPANKNNQIVIPINIVPIHINTSKRTYNEKELIVQGSQEAKIKRRRKKLVYEIIDFIVSLPGIIFSSFKL